MSDIEVIENETPQPVELHVAKAKAGGYLCFYSCDSDYWMQCTPMHPVGVWSDTRRFPYPLFESKDDAIDTAKKYMPNGGKVKLWRLEL